MADDLLNRGTHDRARINLSEDWEVRYWSQKFGVTEQRLREAVKGVGNSTENVGKSLVNNMSRRHRV